MKVLIVEDNHDLAANMKDFFGEEGYVCSVAGSYREAMAAINAFSYDVVLLDIMLPDGSGLGLLEQLKKHEPETGVLIISAKDSLDDKLHGLDLGADDYLTKPFHLSEMNARVKAIYRRRHFQGSNTIVFNEIEINPETFEVVVKGELLVLTRKEYELLLYFLANKNRVCTKQSIAEHLWGDHVDLYDSFDFVYQHIKNLRKKITKAGGGDYIQNLYGMGYKFNTHPTAS